MKHVLIPIDNKLQRELAEYHALMAKPLSGTSAEDFAELTRLFRSISLKTAHTVLAQFDATEAETPLCQ